MSVGHFPVLNPNLKTSELDLEKLNVSSSFLIIVRVGKLKILEIVVDRLRYPDGYKLIRLTAKLRRKVVPLLWVE